MPNESAVREDVIRMMAEAYQDALDATNSTYGGHPLTLIVAMRAAAQVLIDRVLGPVTQEEAVKYGSWLGSHIISSVMASRRAILDPPKPATLQDRVFAIMDQHGKGGDGAWECAGAVAKAIEEGK